MKAKNFAHIFFFFLLFCFSSETKAQIDFSPTKSDTASTYTVVMKDGSILNGKIVSRTKSEIVFSDVNLGTITLTVNKIRTIDRISDDAFVLVTMKSGSKVVGKMLSKNDSVMVVESETLGKVNVPMNQVKEMLMIDRKNIKNGQYRISGNLYSKYFLFGPNAILNKQDEGFFQSANFLLNSIDYGISKNVSVVGGTILIIIPYFGIKSSYEIADNFHMGVGGFVLPTPFFKRIGLPSAVYGVATIGNKEKNISAGVIMAWWKDGSLTPPVHHSTGKPVYTLCGQFRFGRRTAFVSENYFIPVKENSYNTVINYPQSVTSYYYEIVYSYGVRFLGKKNSWDIGFVGTSGLFFDFPIGIPFVSYYRNF